MADIASAGVGVLIGRKGYSLEGLAVSASARHQWRGLSGLVRISESLRTVICARWIAGAGNSSPFVSASHHGLVWAAKKERGPGGANIAEVTSCNVLNACAVPLSSLHISLTPSFVPVSSLPTCRRWQAYSSNKLGLCGARVATPPTRNHSSYG